MNCVIIEDEPLARGLLEGYVERTPGLTLSAAFAGAVDALAYLREHRPDALFLDVQMPELTGIGLLKVLGDDHPPVVLTTAYSEYAVEGYALNVTDYLLKPITYERFLQAIDKLQRGTPPAPPLTAAPPAADHLYFRDGTKLVRVNFADVQYIAGMRDYVRIHTPGRKVTTLQTFKHLTDILPDERFLRIHQSYIVGTAWIEEVGRDAMTVAGADLPVSDKYREAVRAFVAGREA